MKKKHCIQTFLVLLFLLSDAAHALAQTGYLPYSYHFYREMSKELHDKNTRVHSSLKPWYIQEDSLISRSADSVLNYGADSTRKNWITRKIFNEHLIQINREDYSFYGDFLPDMMIGRDFKEKEKTWQNTRGYQFGGAVGKKFSFYTSGYENQGLFPRYYQDFTEKYLVVPGQTNEFFGSRQKTKDWQYVTANISYTPASFINVTFAYDKLFIGDGYRSLLLSDVSSPYPFFKVTANYKSIQYTAVWASLQDPSARAYSYETGNRRKGAIFHYLDWNVTKRLSFGFFDALIWEVENQAGSARPLRFEYVNPVVFLNPMVSSENENSVIGLTAKYELLPKTIVYGQLVSDGMKKESKNRWGYQGGLSGFDLFGAKDLDYLIEYNTVKPYTFAQPDRILNYAHYNQPLGHILGANFKEALSIISYKVNRFGFTGEVLYSRYGMDKDKRNYGKDLFNTTGIGDGGHQTGQGLRTDLYYLDGRISYLLNPKYNLRIEAGAVVRTEKNSMSNQKTSWLTLGLRSSFRNLYQDF